MMQCESRTPRADTRKLVRVDRNLFEREGKYLFIANDPATGKQVKKTLKARTRSDARIEAGKLRADLASGEAPIGNRTLTVEALVESFIDHEWSNLGSRSPRTIDLHEQRLTSHVVLLLGPRTKVCEIRVQHVRRMVDKLRAHPRDKTKPGGKKLSGSTVRGCVTACAAMFRYGVRDLGAVARNPIRDLDRGDLPSGKRQTEPRYLSVEQLDALFSKMTEVTRRKETRSELNIPSTQK
jgi:hypothetical protein